MIGDLVDKPGATRTGSTHRRVRHGRSTITFPYIPLQDVVEMTQMVERRGGNCKIDDLAVDLNQQKTSGAFRGRTSAGRLFGAVEVVRQDVSLTELGMRMCSPDTEADALADAFLTVPLYRKLYDKYAGAKLPPNDEVEADIRRMGVVTGQTAKARQVFIRSAEAAGYFSSGHDRLSRPSAGSIAATPVGAPAPEKPRASRAEAVSMAENPLIRGLVAKLPAEDQPFTPKQRQRWLEAAKVNLDLIYATDDEDEPGMEATSNGLATAQRQLS